MKNLAIIPARGKSKRIPKKNITNLLGKPMLYYTIDAAKRSKLFDKILVSTDNEEIGKIARKYDVDVHMRPKKLRNYNTTTMSIFLNIIEEMEKKNEIYDNIFILLPTSPLRTSEDIKKAFNKFLKNNANALMAVTKFTYSPFWALRKKNGYLKPIWKKFCLLPSQKHPEVFVDNGAIYIFKWNVLKKEKTYYCSRLIGYFMPRERSIDVDEPMDFKLAEFLLKQKK